MTKTRTLKLAPVGIYPHGMAKRRYTLAAQTVIAVHFRNRWYIYTFKPSFQFDGRSGGRIPDLFEPHIGNQQDLIDWLIHDANGYGLLLSYADTNEMLRQMRLESGASSLSANMVKRAVETSKKWYGIPNPTEWEYANIKGQAFTVRVVDELPDLNWLAKDCDATK
jgi:hypothetical protein